MAPILKKRCKFTLRWLLDLENSSLEQNENFGLFAFYPCYFFICCLAAPWLTFGYYWGNSLTQSLVQRWLGKVGSLHLTECPVGFDGNGITHLATRPKLQKILSPHLHPDFPKCGNAPNIQSSYSLTLWWPLGLHNISLDATFSVQNFSFCWWIKSMS